MVVRFGGEEFLFLLPDSGPDETARALARLRQDLERSPLVFKDRTLPITFSAGIAVRKRGESSDSVVSRADRALYQAKGNGGNRACLWTPSQPEPETSRAAAADQPDD